MTHATIAQRLAASLASVAITFVVLTGVASYAKPSVASPLMAQAGGVTVR